MKVRSPSGQNFTKKMSQDLENWMTNLPQNLKSIPIIYLSIPGSHDSFTANITANSEVSPDAEPVIQYLACFGPLVKYFISNWSRTQRYSAIDQLKSGIRYFDLRIATKTNTNDFFIVHGLYSIEVSAVLNDIEGFLETHPGEVVIIDCQHFYAFSQEDHNLLMQLITGTFKTKLMPFSEHMDVLNLGYMTEQYRYQVVCIYRSDVVRFGQPMFWPASSFPTPWFDTVDKEKLFNELDNGLKNRDSNTAYISQCVLTPSKSFVVMNLFSTLKQKCAVDFCNDRTKWIMKQRPFEQGLNIIIGDYIDLSNNDFVRNVIDLNVNVLNHTNKCSHNIIEMPPVHTK